MHGRVLGAVNTLRNRGLSDIWRESGRCLPRAIPAFFGRKDRRMRRQSRASKIGRPELWQAYQYDRNLIEGQELSGRAQLHGKNREQHRRDQMNLIAQIEAEQIAALGKEIPDFKPGDTIRAEQSLITVESDKASMEIPSSHAGVVKEVKVKLGDKVKQGSVVVVLEVLVVRKVAALTRGYSLTKLVKVELEFFLILPAHQLAMVVVVQVMQVAALVQQLVAGLVVLRH